MGSLPGHEVDHSPPVLRIRMNGAILLLPPCAFTAWARTFFLSKFGGVFTGIDRYSADNLTLCCSMAVLPHVASCARLQPSIPRGMCRGVEGAPVQVMIRKKT